MLAVGWFQVAARHFAGWSRRRQQRGFQLCLRLRLPYPATQLTGPALSGPQLLTMQAAAEEAAASREQLLDAVEEHFAAQEVEENEVIACFLNAVKRHRMGLPR